MAAVPPPGGTASADDRQWSMFAWLGVIIIGFIGPLIVLLTKGNESEFVKKNASEALNFSIWIAIYYVAAFILGFIIGIVTCGVGFLIVFVPIVLQVTFGIIGAMKTNQGEVYMCPMNFYRFIN